MPKRSHSSQQWLKEHEKDPFVKQARVMGYRSRATFKLADIQERDKLLRPGQTVVDLGAAPGGWSQLAQNIVGKNGQVIAMDILAMDPITQVTFIQGDFTEPEIYQALLDITGAQPVDVVLSDMAPNMSGNRQLDQDRSMYLAEIALQFSLDTLKTGGDFLIKVFHGQGFDAYIKTLRQHFTKILTRKPDASRDRSRETYLLARQRK